ncbi:hypothetical protein A2454_04130 [Candidatus Peribacteria bacterium RIFOXYC2_FULL_55_14]|nr:MAG: TrpR like protein, YerC/YecD [Candidatus Peribacteria bacterium GW2011_GWC2_54_8]KKW42870.1 MAG: TrpR like protein, YerC/YecD [Candidatus Peregrinibacteria bacterium GW2011_GWA2_54_9]OGJ72240.1 MAG: hypothetical protein A2198_02330 [Candidatus Peribacteria bacterium RIFOXYA1_FULL_56_14]OGJ73609.1 MAG: hypothetical protein A2217_03910 [Candidatus Peribacteria bacterium RIFOXYA2_FULL_55_28]OGJ75813.1 MAG: hypothetical protein A2384_02465 [Candidatus Peribacteria bacterium RIFOXYB1_FULL_54
MPKKRFTEDSWRKERWFQALCYAIASCETTEDVADFLRDIGTLSELQAWSERFEVAKQLSQGRTYREIAADTGASTTTVTRVARFIENGEGGYRKVLNVVSKGEETLSPTELLVQRKIDHQHRTRAPGEERQVSMLKKYLKK